MPPGAFYPSSEHKLQNQDPPTLRIISPIPVAPLAWTRCWISWNQLCRRHLWNPGTFFCFDFFGPTLGPGTRPDVSGSPRYRWARAQSRIWSRFCQKSQLFVEIQVSKRYLSVLRTLDSWISLQESFHGIRNVFFLPYKVLNLDFCLPITPKSWILQKRISKNWKRTALFNKSSRRPKSWETRSPFPGWSW